MQHHEFNNIQLQEFTIGKEKEETHYILHHQPYVMSLSENDVE